MANGQTLSKKERWILGVTFIERWMLGVDIVVRDSDVTMVMEEWTQKIGRHKRKIDA